MNKSLLVIIYVVIFILNIITYCNYMLFYSIIKNLLIYI